MPGSRRKSSLSRKEWKRRGGTADALRCAERGPRIPGPRAPAVDPVFKDTQDSPTFRLVPPQLSHCERAIWCHFFLRALCDLQIRETCLARLFLQLLFHTETGQDTGQGLVALHGNIQGTQLVHTSHRPTLSPWSPQPSLGVGLPRLI